ncbi:MFS general substrate transporter [Cylindrobasidium torrendii FP15055 ss-10]|uniref:MFS general substrate transporter n=1 Tax=Cylindrobasidium torrendii FP15055 ss-10 TaxID=1314674 RepID=A0A0D7B0Z0_9AGAR|nr:MFS general substrate transporter [Cylindrobasidium torrendii FP15055 ss-10]
MSDVERVPEKTSLSSHSLEVSEAERARILRKLDLNVLPMLATLYLFSFLDRTNIGNAVLGGLKTDLKLTSQQYNIAVSIFFASYVSWEAFSNIFLKKLRPSRYIPLLCLIWGLVTTLTCLVKNFAGLVVVRIFLGLSESALFPGICFIISIWYPRNSTCFRFALFFASASLAGAFGGLLARGLMTIEASGIEHWRSIYLVEGLVTMGVATLAFFFLKDDFNTAHFLTSTEKDTLRDLLEADRPNESQEFSWAEVKDALTSGYVWVNAIQSVGVGLPIFSFSVFLPSIVKGLGFSNATSQLMTVPPYAFAAIGTCIVGYYSDKHGVRGVYLQAVSVIGIIGYAIQLGTLNNGARYFGVFLITFSVYCGNAIGAQWAGNNLKGHSRRATGMGFQVAFGNLAAIGGSYIYPTPHAPRYVMGHAIALGCLGLAFTTATILTFWLREKNKKLDREAEEIEKRGEVADRSFRFML